MDDSPEQQHPPVGSALSEERYRRLFETAQDGILLITFPEGVIFDANPFFLKIVGFSSEDIIGKRLWELGFLTDKQASEDMHRELMAVGYVRYEHLDLLSRAGHPVPVEFVSNVYEIHGQRVAQCNIRDISDRRRTELALERERELRQTLLFEVVETLGAVVAGRDPYTASHQKRVASLACAIAQEMGLTSDQIQGIRISALLHDIGKITVPIEILTKPGQLTELEIALLRTHAQAGYDILRSIHFPWPVAQIVLEHHERLDGSGYPKARTGDQILIEARILAVADLVEAMSSQRPYRVPATVEHALQELERSAGKLYDPDASRCCLHLFRQGGYTFPDPDFKRLPFQVSS